MPNFSSNIKQQKSTLLKYFAELLVVVFGVFLGFMANDYAQKLNQQDYVNITIKGMYNNLALDISDAEINLKGHKDGLESINYFIKILKGEAVKLDSFNLHHHRFARSFISVQNTSQFETIRSKGFNVIKDDSLRKQMIKLYDFEYEVLEKIEEKYQESQIYANEYHPIISILGKSMVFDKNLQLIKIKNPLPISNDEKSYLILIFKRLHLTRNFNIKVYENAIKEMKALRTNIAKVYPFVLKQ
ncbi:MAG: hypothetical protein R2774_12830 [Saprospiraceae bacterium]